MTQSFIQSGDLFHPSGARDNIHATLPPGLYSLVSTQSGPAFKSEDDFKKLTRVYGDHERLANRILYSFEERPGNTGVLLAGTKGSGKSFLARMISLAAHSKGIPTIMITSPWDGENLRDILTKLPGPAVILIDEFEKIYTSRDSQQSLLSFMDGLSTTKHLFLFTVNNLDAVDSHMRNRPGRLYYLMEFHGLDENFIREFCEDKLQEKMHVEGVVNLSRLFREFNFDMLNSLVEEMNRFNESPAEAARYLNISPVELGRSIFNYTVHKLSEPDELLGEGRISINPFEAQDFDVELNKKKHEDNDWGYEDLTLDKSEMSSMEEPEGIFTYLHEDYVIKLVREGKPNAASDHHWTSVLKLS